ncbi:MAG: hypothetical protein M0Q26_13960 [Chitinophagaceae bacterium]|nr:hypothetical protein [Chitinophagaceae bacterium]MDP1763454.1 hypothetical protein [Sediminibacterium sp.]
MTKNKQLITCQEILDDAKELFPRKHAKIISQNSNGISLRRVYAVYSGIITDPEKILEVANSAVKTIREKINPGYAKGRKMVFKKHSSTKLKS